MMGGGPGPRPNPGPEMPLVGGGEATSPLLPLLSPTSPTPVAPAPAGGVLWPGAKGGGGHIICYRATPYSTGLNTAPPYPFFLSPVPALWLLAATATAPPVRRHGQHNTRWRSTRHLARAGTRFGRATHTRGRQAFLDPPTHPSVPLTPLALARLVYASDSQRALACTFKGSFPFPAQWRGSTRAKLRTTRHTRPVFSFTPTR